MKIIKKILDFLDIKDLELLDQAYIEYHSLDKTYED